MPTTEQYQQAEVEYSIADARRGFKVHAIVYAIVNLGLITLNAVLIATTAANFPWAVFPLVGWGIGLTFHYVAAFRRGSKDVRARQEEIERYAARRAA
jgi:hypothetical protein